MGRCLLSEVVLPCEREWARDAWMDEGVERL